MPNCTQGIKSALAYIEDNLTQEIKISQAAKCAYVSPFHFQRLFSALCGISVGEYICRRRLTLAGIDLKQTEEKVIDLAIKYGYDSPDSFTQAFSRFHGITPTQARHGAQVRTFAPISLNPKNEISTVLQYKIVHKPSFTLFGLKRRFSMDGSYRNIPKYWDEVMSDPAAPIYGRFGLCAEIQNDEREFDYYIADLYLPWQEIPQNCAVRVIPESDWAIFPCTLQTLQKTNSAMWSKWLPNCSDWCLGMNLNLEYYAMSFDDPQNDYCELWPPIKKTQGA